MKNIAIFASGEGTNFQALADAIKVKQINGKIVLLVSSNKNAGAIKRAEKENIPYVIASLKDFESSEAYDKHLTGLCLKHKIDLICLAGFMLKLGDFLLSEFENKIINIHPALLPSFGGNGMYGMKVHKAVLASGSLVSGTTTHFVNKDYDSGPIIGQRVVSIINGDTPETLAKRISREEHILYCSSVELFCDDLLRIEENKVKILQSEKEAKTAKKIKRALISVSDKTGIVEFAGKLSEMGIEIISTSATYKLISDAGIKVTPLENITGFPEILGGRVKTLHPLVHGGILFKRDEPSHIEDAEKLGIGSIDIVAVNLYPFSETAKKAAPWSEELIENIDIGGVALLRAAAKNYRDVIVLSRPADYEKAIKAIFENDGDLSIETRRELSLKAFEHTACYDAAISETLDLKSEEHNKIKFPGKMNLSLNKINNLRYGENPHQDCALYSKNNKLPFEQLQGKPLSYNNILDAYGTWQSVMEFKEPSAVIFKHVTPCGMAKGENILEAFVAAWSCDPVSAFGGIIAVNKTLDANIAEFLSKKFIEVICAPDFDKAALEILKKKKNLRLLKWNDFPKDNLVFKSIGDELLISEDDKKLLAGKWDVATIKKPSEIEEKALK
ncbi:MAG: bifunctional phosphoribosylaminoimidazolecarboxamide formyltransferase/IMP cyclohydrolase, partial [Elusimicrobiales bacterium]|nr:bifunctional phosphoribosylaminoimidazolecarboxamide formyltransferase/IMP cyclohydrolase [Elusimicrobiales bacterium]